MYTTGGGGGGGEAGEGGALGDAWCTVSASAFLACYQCWSAGSSLA